MKRLDYSEQNRRHTGLRYNSTRKPHVSERAAINLNKDNAAALGGRWSCSRRSWLARLSLERNRSSDKKSRKIEKLERILVAKVWQLLRNSL